MSRRSAEQWAAPLPSPEPAAVDVLIPTCDRPAELAVTLAGLAAQQDPAFRVVISDQSSEATDWEQPAASAMVRVLRAQGSPVTTVRHLPRQGLAEHRQFLLEQSTADKCLFLDDDIWLEPGSLKRLADALDELGCGFVGMAPQGLSYLEDQRPAQTEIFQAWKGPVTPETIRPDTPEFDRWTLHNAANLSHISADLGLGPGTWLPYRVAWIGGCAMYRRQALQDVGGFTFWRMLPPEHAGEDVLVQWRVMERFGGAGILPSGAVYLESPTTVTERKVEAFDVVLGRDPQGRDRQGRTPEPS